MNENELMNLWRFVYNMVDQKYKRESGDFVMQKAKCVFNSALKAIGTEVRL